MTAPTIEECLELIAQQKEALKWSCTCQFYERADDDKCAACKALSLTPSSVREAIQPREKEGRG